MFKYQPIDKKQVEDRIQKLHNPGQKRNIFKVTQQPQVIRIIPYVHNESGCPFIEKNLHYGLKDGTMVCPTSYGEDCPICSFGSSLWKKGQKDMAKKFFKKSRIFVPVLVRDSNDTEPKFLGLSDSTYQDILSTIADPDYGDVIHPMEGRDMTIVKIPEGQYGKIVIKFKPKTSPIADSEKAITAILESCPNFDTIYPKKSTEELEEVLKKSIRNQASEDGTPAVSTGGASKSSSYLAEIDKALDN